MAIMFEPLRKYATFRGRARRLEYWSFQLLVALLFTGLTIWFLGALGPDATQAWDPTDMAKMQELLAASPGASLPANLIAFLSLGLVLPSLAVSVRRLHDSDKSGWWLLLGLTAIGGLVLFIFYLLDGTRGPNRHGPDPKERTL
jgi:uncharacterized membrane protein YhaH (DUF805 family)